MKKILFIALLSFGFMANAMAQHFDEGEEVIEQSESDKVFEVVDEMPSFPGGQSALFDFMEKNIKYPKVAEDNGIQGRVILTFIVKKDGSLSDVRVAKSVDPALDKEAVRLVESMPKWNLGKKDGQFVNVRICSACNFQTTIVSI